MNEEIVYIHVRTKNLSIWITEGSVLIGEVYMVCIPIVNGAGLAMA